MLYVNTVPILLLPFFFFLPTAWPVMADVCVPAVLADMLTSRTGAYTGISMTNHSVTTNSANGHVLPTIETTLDLY